MGLPRECPPLIAENIGKLDDYGHTISLERVAAAAIDSIWHYSWHWERDNMQCWDAVTLRGWQQALENGRERLASLERQAKAISDVLPLIEAQIATMEREEMEEDGA